MVPLSRVRALFTQLLHLHESPHRTALAFSVGVFIAFCPAYGFHTLMVVFSTWAFRMNFVALMAGAFINNPWTIIPILGATFWTGARLMGMPDVPPFDWSDLSFMGIYRQAIPYALPFFLGGIVLSLLGALVSYPVAYYFISKYRRTQPIDQGEPLPPRPDVG